MAQWLTALAALAENPGSVPVTHMVYNLYNLVQEYDPLFWSLQVLHTHGANIHIKPTNKQKEKPKTKLTKNQTFKSIMGGGALGREASL